MIDTSHKRYFISLFEKKKKETESMQAIYRRHSLKQSGRKIIIIEQIKRFSIALKRKKTRSDGWNLSIKIDTIFLDFCKPEDLYIRVKIEQRI